MNNLVTPRTLAERIIRLEERGNQPSDSELDIREVVAIIVDVASKLLKINIYQERNGTVSKSIPSHYIHTFRKVPVKIKTNANDTLNFITIPARYASLPYNAGVRNIIPNTGKFYKNKPMIPLNQGDEFILGELIGSMQKQWVYSLQGEEAFFQKMCGKTLCESGIEYVDVVLVTILGEISLDTPLNVPPELHHDIILGSLELLGPSYGMKPKKDKINDNNPDAITS